MAALHKLPRELLDLILLHLPYASQRTLLYVCRRLHTVAKPAIYRKIRLTLCLEDGHDRSNCVIVQFFRTLVTANLSLISEIQELEISGPKPLTLLTEMSDRQTYVWLSRIQPSLGTRMHWENQLLKGDTDVMIAALISSLHNLRVLRLGFDVWSASRYLSKVIASRSKLEEIELSSSMIVGENYLNNEIDEYKTSIFKTANGPISYDTQLLHNLLSLQRLKNVTIMAAEPRDSWFTMSTDPPLTPHTKLTRLCLEASELKPSSLGLLTREMPNLRQLEYKNLIDAHHGGPTMQYFQCADMDAALTSVRSSLEHLCVDVEFFADKSTYLGLGFNWGVQGTIKCLADFTCLTHLEIPLVLLLGWKPNNNSDNVNGSIQLETVLPRTLKYFKLTTALEYFEINEWSRSDICMRVSDYVKFVTATNMDGPRNLEEISLDLCKDYNTRNDVATPLMRTICAEAGITLRISEYDW
jgi:hypothetical protein